MTLSVLVGLLDGLGLAMFIPMLQLVSGDASVDHESMGQMAVVLELAEDIGFNLTFKNVLLLILIFFCLKGAMKFLNSAYQVLVRRDFIINLRVSLIELLRQFGYKQFVTSDSGQIQNTLSGEMIRVNVAFTAYFNALQNFVLVIVYVTLAFFTDYKFTTLVIIGGGLTNIFFQWIYKQTKRLSKEVTSDSNRFQGLLLQYVNFYRYLRASGSIDTFSQKMREMINQMEGTIAKSSYLKALTVGTREPLVIIVVVAVIYLQVEVFEGSLGLIILSLLFFYRSLTFLVAYQEKWTSFLTYTGSLHNLFEFKDHLRQNFEENGTLIHKGFNDSLKFDGVDLAYNEHKVLKNVNLTIKKNETVALVGPSGSGKSTMLNVISGLVLPDLGQFMVDDHSMKDIDRTSFRKTIGFVAQEPAIFDDTIFNNVTFWSSSEDKNRFESSMEKSASLQFVNELPNKEKTMLGMNGINISGGQKQRLSIARELYKEVEILLLDEATSALDSETEKHIQGKIDELKGQYTIVIVAHRLSTIKNADRIILMDSGEIKDQGTFDELLKKSADFERMVALQNFD